MSFHDYANLITALNHIEEVLRIIGIMLGLLVLTIVWRKK